MLKKKFILAFASFLLLLIPFVAMQFTDEVNWSHSDFLIMGILLFAVGLSLKWVTKHIKSKVQQWVLKMFILLVLIMLWAEMAVGILGSPIAGN